MHQTYAISIHNGAMVISGLPNQQKENNDT